MSKEYLEALECLEKIKNQLFEYFKSTGVSTDFIGDYEELFVEPIKQALLKAQEQEKFFDDKLVFKNGCIISGFDYKGKQIVAMPLEEYDGFMKQEKALEIIKEKRVDLPYLRCCIEDNQSVERYNEYIRNKTMDYDHEQELTEEEFDLLKEVLE